MCWPFPASSRVELGLRFGPVNVDEGTREVGEDDGEDENEDEDEDEGGGGGAMKR